MANVYISFLGTNDYLPCIYTSGEYKSGIIRFVQEATIERSCSQWGKNDKVLIFSTGEAEKKNWVDDGHVDHKTKDVLRRKGLYRCLKALDLPPEIEMIPVPEGKSEAEIWDIFNIVFNFIRQGDEVVFDITHAFRSIPMLAIVILNYAKAMKGVKLLGIYYGAFEVLGTIFDAKNIEPEKRYVPILDLTPLDQLMEWSFAADRFITSGDAGQLSSLAERSARAILSGTKGRDRKQNNIRYLAKSLREFTNNLSSCRGRKISDSVKRLKQHLESCINTEFNNPLNQPLIPVFERIKKQMDQFPEDTILDGIQAAKWCAQHNLVQQGYTILLETLINLFLFKATGDREVFDRDRRSLVAVSLNVHEKNLRYEAWETPALDHRNLVERLLRYYEAKPNLPKLFRNITDLRNDINHGGMRENEKPFKTLENKLHDFIEEAEREIEI